MRSIRRFLFVTVLLLVTAACGQATPVPTALPSATSTPEPTAAPTAFQAIQNENIQPRQRATVRIINAAPDTPPLNVFTGFQAVAANLGFGQFTDATSLDADTYEIKVTPSGSRPSDPPLLETTLEIKGGESNLLLLTKIGETLTLTSLPTSVEPVGTGQSIITFINVLASGEQAMMRQNNADLTTSIGSGQTATTGLLPAGASTFEFASQGTKLLDYDSALKERKHYTFILAGTAAAPSVVELSFDAPGRTSVRALNASPSLDPIDVYLDDQPINTSVVFGRSTDPQNRIAGDYTALIYSAGADRNAVEPMFSQKVVLENDQNLNLIVVGSPGKLQIVPYNEDLTPTPPNRMRIAFVNPLEQYPRVHLETTAGVLPELSEMVYGDMPKAALLSASTYTFYLTAADAAGVNQTVEIAENLQFEQGRNYLYIITQRLDGNPIIVSESVGVNEQLADFSDTGGVAETIGSPAQIRYINALNDQTPLDMLVDNEIVVSQLGYGQGSELIPVSRKNPRISIQVSGDTTALNSLSTTVEELARYTVLVYGQDRASAQILLIPDSDLIFDGTSPHLRLINASYDGNTSFGLGIAEARFVPSNPDAIRQPIPAGVQRTVERVAEGSASPVILVPVNTLNLFVIDAITNELAASILNTEMKTGSHYDIVAYQETNSQRVHALLFEYPAR